MLGESSHFLIQIQETEQALQSVVACIETGEFMHVYNAIVVLKEILPVFPLSITGSKGFRVFAAITSLLEKEERGDLKILAKA